MKTLPLALALALLAGPALAAEPGARLPDDRGQLSFCERFYIDYGDGAALYAEAEAGKLPADFAARADVAAWLAAARDSGVYQSGAVLAPCRTSSQATAQLSALKALAEGGEADPAQQKWLEETRAALEAELKEAGLPADESEVKDPAGKLVLEGAALARARQQAGQPAAPAYQEPHGEAPAEPLVTVPEAAPAAAPEAPPPPTPE